ncbi:MAG: SDR family oxidoreductase [Candidatus Woesearchaeota archaeon]
MKKAIITGASSGLGKEIGNLLKEKDVEVVNISTSKSEFIDIKTDLGKENELLNAIQKIKDEHSNFDYLILNAGIMPLADIGKINYDIDKLFKINVTSSIKIVNELIDLIKNNKSDIVVIGSTSSFKPNPSHGVYTSTKHATDGFIKSLQMELKDIRVIGFHPGGFNSNLRNGIIKEGYMDPKDLAKILINILELPKNIEVSEIILNRKKKD